MTEKTSSILFPFFYGSTLWTGDMGNPDGFPKGDYFIEEVQTFGFRPLYQSTFDWLQARVHLNISWFQTLAFDIYEQTDLRGQTWAKPRPALLIELPDAISFDDASPDTPYGKLLDCFEGNVGGDWLQKDDINPTSLLLCFPRDSAETTDDQFSCMETLASCLRDHFPDVGCHPLMVTAKTLLLHATPVHFRDNGMFTLTTERHNSDA